MVEPNLTVTDLQRGNDIRKPAREIDIKFTSQDYLRQTLLRERRAVYNQVKGHSKAFDTLDTTLEFLRQWEQEKQGRQ